MEYLHGAQVHEPAGYELTGSGGPPATPHDFDAQKTVPDVTVRGPCGNPGLIEEISGCDDMGASRVIPLAAPASSWLLPQRRRGDCVIIETPCYVAPCETPVVPAALGDVLRPPATSEETNRASRCRPRF